MAGQGFLDLLNVRVGDWVRMTVGDQPQILHIVGRSIEPENAGRVISTSLDTLRENDPGSARPSTNSAWPPEPTRRRSRTGSLGPGAATWTCTR